MEQIKNEWMEEGELTCFQTETEKQQNHKQK